MKNTFTNIFDLIDHLAKTSQISKHTAYEQKAYLNMGGVMQFDIKQLYTVDRINQVYIPNL